MMWKAEHLLQSGKYRVKRQIGGGGFGLTYLAEDCFLNRQVVIKTPNQTFEADQDYEGFVRRFQREGQSLARISHPNIVQVIEIFKEAGMPCLVMVYVEGETLNEYVRRQGRLSQDEAVRIFRKLAEALHQLHQSGLIHCDLHPGNIILRPDREPVLIDFGSAKLLQPSTLTVTTTVNESFTPYEQRQKGGKPQPSWDIYGLAATLYFAVTGQKPEAAINRKLYGDTLKSPKQYCSNLSSWMEQAILGGMALEAENRPSSMQAWINLLNPPPTSQSAQSYQPRFPWCTLSFLIFMYVDAGLIASLSSLEVWPKAWSFTTLIAGYGTVALLGAIERAWLLATLGILTEVGMIAQPLVQGKVVQPDGLLFVFIPIAVAFGTKAAAAEVFEARSIIYLVGFSFGIISGRFLRITTIPFFAIVLALLGGSISAYFDGIEIWVGFGFGAIAIALWWIIIIASIVSERFLSQYYRSDIVLIAFCIVPVMCFLLGSILGEWFKFPDFKLPI